MKGLGLEVKKQSHESRTKTGYLVEVLDIL